MQNVATALAPFAAAAGLIYTHLALRVIKRRKMVRVGLGTGGDAALERAIRAHGNFAEYVPLALIMILLTGLCGWNLWIVRALAALLLFGRIAHAYGVSQVRENFRFRIVGMMSTFAVYGLSGLLLLVAALGFVAT